MIYEDTSISHVSLRCTVIILIMTLRCLLRLL